MRCLLQTSYLQCPLEAAIACYCCLAPEAYLELDDRKRPVHGEPSGWGWVSTHHLSPLLLFPS